MTIIDKLIEDRTFNSAEKLYLLALVTKDNPDAQSEWMRRRLVESSISQIAPAATLAWDC